MSDDMTEDRDVTEAFAEDEGGVAVAEAPVVAELPKTRSLSEIDEMVAKDNSITSFLITMVLSAGLLFGIYGVNWLLSIEGFKRQEVGGPIEAITIDDGDEEGKAGTAPDLGEVPEEMYNQELQAPNDSAPPEITDNLQQLIAETDFTDPNLQQRNRGGEEGGAGGYGSKGKGFGKGGKRRGERWTIEWGSENRTAYKRKLDFFNIYIGAVRGGNLLTAVRGFSGGQKEQTMKPPELWFVHQDKNRIEEDRQILKDAGIPVLQTDIICQFYTAELQNKMAEVEKAHANKKEEEIKRTVFGIRPGGGGFEMYVLEQQLN